MCPSLSYRSPFFDSVREIRLNIPGTQNDVVRRKIIRCIPLIYWLPFLPYPWYKTKHTKHAKYTLRPTKWCAVLLSYWSPNPYPWNKTMHKIYTDANKITSLTYRSPFLPYPWNKAKNLACKTCTLTRRILHAVSLSYGLPFVPYPQNKTTYSWHAKHTHWTLYAVSLSYRLLFVSYSWKKKKHDIHLERKIDTQNSIRCVPVILITFYPISNNNNNKNDIHLECKTYTPTRRTLYAVSLSY